jgi:outer membrane immunogenic protein
MKKMMAVFVVLLGLTFTTATAAFAQESRQDVSISGETIFGPQVYGNAVTQTSTVSGGFLASYRYMLTPRSALEVNYGWAHNSQLFSDSETHSIPGCACIHVHTRQQEFTAAYVYTRNYRNFNPFAEVGLGVMVFTPLRDAGTASLDLSKANKNVGMLAGLGLAYELSPSFDIRAEYRGFLAKAPSFNSPENDFKTNRYEWFSVPSIGIAYHF